MSSPLLLRFATTVVRRLRDAGRLVVVDGRADEVARDVADHLDRVSHASLVSSFSRALLSSANVEELFADDDEIKAIIDDLNRDEAGL